MPTRFEMVMLDRMSGPAKTALDAVWKLDLKVQGLAKTLRTQLKSAVSDAKGQMRGIDGKFTTSLFTGARGALNRALGGGGGGGGGGFLGGGGWGAIIAGATAAAMAVGTISYALGRNVIEMAAFRESTLASLETVMGSSEAAGRTFNNAMRIAGQTPLDTDGVVNMANRFAVAGFQERELAPLMGAASDLAAAFGQQQADSFSLVVAQMRSAGKMDRGDLRQLLNAGVNTGEVLDSIARQLGINASTERARRQAVLSAITHGRVTGDMGITASMEAINRRMDGGGQLGSYARRQSETLTGAISNAHNAWSNLLMGMRTEDSPGLQAMARGVLAITEALGPDNPIGSELRGLVSDFTNILGEGIFGGDSTSTIDTVTSMIRNLRPLVIDTLAGIIAFGRGFYQGFMYFLGPAVAMLARFNGIGTSSADRWERLGLILGNVSGVIAVGVGGAIATVLGLSTAFFGFLGAMNGYGVQIVTWFETVPSQMVDGFIAGLHSNWTRITDTLSTLASGLTVPVRAALGIHSPSTVMRELGEHTAEGFRLGVEGGASDVAAAMAGLANAPALAGAAGGASGGGNIYLTVQVEAHPGTDGAAVGQTAGAAIIRQLAEVFGALNQSPA